MKRGGFKLRTLRRDKDLYYNLYKMLSSSKVRTCSALLTVSLALLLGSFYVEFVHAVLRFPDSYYDDRWPLHYTDCEGLSDEFTIPVGDWKEIQIHGREAWVTGMTSQRWVCYNHLKRNMLDDLDCSAITNNNEVYLTHVPDAVWVSSCTDFVQIFNTTFGIAMELADGLS